MLVKILTPTTATISTVLLVSVVVAVSVPVAQELFIYTKTVAALELVLIAGLCNIYRSLFKKYPYSGMILISKAWSDVVQRASAYRRWWYSTA